MTEEDYKPFDFKEYTEHLQSESFRNEQLKQLVQNYRLQKTINRENLAILSSFSDPEKKADIFKSVCQVWSGVLESDTEVSTIEDIILMSLATEDCVKL